MKIENGKLKIMEIVSVDDPRALKKALHVLRTGGVVVYPTETAYGLGGDWTKRNVHARIQRIKGRSPQKQLSVVVASAVMARRYAYMSAAAKALARKYWPGALSLVLPCIQGKRTLSVRVSPHPIAMRLTRRLGRPLIATSANISNSPTLYDAQAIVRAFSRPQEKPDLIIDAGRLPRVRPSTVVRVQGSVVEVLREGPVKIKAKPNSKFKSDKVKF